MDPKSESWSRIEALVDELLDLDPSDRPRTLARARATDPAVAEEAERLLRAMDNGGDDLLDSPIFIGSPELVAGATEDAARDRAGTVLGPYRLTEVLGRGGMGVVYLAERADEEFEKRVAIKLMPRGLESDEAERRFRLERQVLARLEHPHIARLLDGGVTDEGYPYLVMELIEGQPIDSYCDAAALRLEDRLRLFLDVCGAVQYAHQSLVIHRDLKPSNILVSEEGEVKLLDFGVAKLVDEDPGADTDSFTRVQPRTANYASPEQLANQPVSTATDTYSLGVVLHLLLTGSLPGEAKEGAQSLALPADLDRVLQKALADDPDERYAIAAALGDDLSRFLDGQPVSAHEPTVGYRLRKFVSRHRASVIASVTAAIALTATLVTALWQADRARIEARRADRVATLLSGLFTDADPWAPTSGEVTVPELLERGVERVRADLADDPATRTQLLGLLGEAYVGQGNSESGTPLLREALTEQRDRLGERHPETVESMRLLGHTLITSELEEAAPWVEASLALAEELYGSDQPETADFLFSLGMLRNTEQNYEDGERVFRRLVENLRRWGEDPSARLALALGQLSVALDFLGRGPESLEIQARAVEMAAATMGSDHPYTTSFRNNLGLRYLKAGNYESALLHLKRALEQFEGLPNVHEQELVAPLSNVGHVLRAQGDFAAALPYVERAAEIARRIHTPEDFTRIGAEINLASVECELGRFETAAAGYRDSLDRFEGMLGAGHQATARARSLLGWALALQGDTGQASEALTEALSVQRTGGRDPLSLDETLVALGRLRLDTGRLDESRSLHEEALAIRQKLPPGHWRRAEVELELAALAQARGTPDPELVAESRRVLADALPEGNFRLVRAKRMFGDL